MKWIINIRITLFLTFFTSQTTNFAYTAVLDPALYLFPSPPLVSPFGTGENELWTRTSRSTKLQHLEESAIEQKETSTTMDQESMDNAETFWPRLHSIDHAIKQIHVVPVSFTLSGNYGGYRGTGVLGNSYASLGSTSLFSYGKSALAGSGYGNYRSPVRIYSGSDGPTWGGWGNGKWGHYGKG